MLTILKTSAPILIQGEPRFGWMHEGIPHGGALIPELQRSSNISIGNTPFAPTLELFGKALLHVTTKYISIDGNPVIPNPSGIVEVAAPTAYSASYVAVPGGLDIQPVCGARSALLLNEVEGVLGRFLKSGDRLPMVNHTSPALLQDVLPNIDLSSPIRIFPGPFLEHFSTESLHLFTTNTYFVSYASNRVGIRLNGPPISRITRDIGHSMPMIRGAVQIPPNGQPIVLGPDHPTTGGYPILAIIHQADWSSIGARSAGSEVSFTLCPAGNVDTVSRRSGSGDFGFE